MGHFSFQAIFAMSEQEEGSRSVLLLK